MKKLIKVMLVAVTLVAVGIISSKGPASITKHTETTASAKTILWKYGKAWMYTTEVTSLGKKSYAGHKYQSYRVYQSKGDLKAAVSMGLTIAGTAVGGKWAGVATNYIGSFYHPKHGLATTIVWIPNKANVILSMAKWK